MKKFRYGRMKVYTKGGDGGRIYMGKCGIYREKGGYCLSIDEKQYRLSATGVFFLEPSRLFYRMHRGLPVKVRICGRSRVVPVQLVIAIEGKIC